MLTRIYKRSQSYLSGQYYPGTRSVSLNFFAKRSLELTDPGALLFSPPIPPADANMRFNRSILDYQRYGGVVMRLREVEDELMPQVVATRYSSKMMELQAVRQSWDAN